MNGDGVAGVRFAAAGVVTSAARVRGARRGRRRVVRRGTGRYIVLLLESGSGLVVVVVFSL